MATRKTRAQLDAEMGVDQPSEAPQESQAEGVKEEAPVEETPVEEASEDVAEEKAAEDLSSEAPVGAKEEEAAEDKAAEDLSSVAPAGAKGETSTEEGAPEDLSSEAPQGAKEEEAVEAEAVEEKAVENEVAEEEAAEDLSSEAPQGAKEEEAAGEEVAGEEVAEEEVAGEEVADEETAAEDLSSEAPTGAEEEDLEDEGPDLDASLEHRLLGVLESLLFAAAEPVQLKRLAQVVREFHPDVSSQKVRKLLERLRDELREQGRGLRISEVAGSFQLRTPSETAPYVKKLVTTRPPRLTRATLETLAIVAYRQPVTRPEVEDIRGVDCGAVLKHLLEKRLIKILGRKDEVGRPLLYATSQDFLEFFGLRDLKSLPTLKDFVELSDEHRAQLGLSPKEEAEAKARDGDQIPVGDLVPDSEDAFVPIGQDEVITELAQALDDVRTRDRDLRRSGALPGASKKKVEEEGEDQGEKGEAEKGGEEQGEKEKTEEGAASESGGEEEVKEEPSSAPEGAAEGAPASAPEGADIGAEQGEDPKGSEGADG